MEVKDNVLEIVLTRFDKWETNEEKEEYIELVEGLVAKYSEAMANDIELVPDSIFDACKDILTAVKPDSPILKVVWSKDDESVEVDKNLDRHFLMNPMYSITTIKSMYDKPLRDFQNKLPAGVIKVLNACKLNGHGIRFVYDDGVLVKANSRGRTTLGRDLTRHVRLILGDYNPNLKGKGIVEFRGEALLPFSNLAKAKEFKPNIKSAFTGVSSMIRDSASDEEVQLLHIVVYGVYQDDVEFKTLSEEYKYIESLGFEIPYYEMTTINRKTFDDDIEEILASMEINTEDYDYYTDGVVTAIDDKELFNDFGVGDSVKLGNLALKMKKWRQDGYSGVIKEIKWTYGKTKITPVAVIEGTPTATGNTVTNVPLYTPANILIAEAYPGNIIHFKYGGEAGVVPTTEDGRLLKDMKDMED